MLVKLLLNFKSTILFDLRNVKTVLKSEINQINLCCLAVAVLQLIVNRKYCAKNLNHKL
jgi:hypothetical protein